MPGPDGMLEDMASRLISPALIGRRAELADLEAAFAAARRGEPATVLLGGEAGIGKSRLAAEFAAHARAEGGRVLAGGCLELGAEGLPFAPFTAVLRELMREIGAPGVIGLLGGRAGDLARLLPDLGTAESEPGDPAGTGADVYPGEGRGRLFEQVLTLLEQLSDRGPVVLIIEDLHWADRSTRDLLYFLVSNQRVLPGVLILGTFRSDELHRVHPLRPLLAELARLAWVQRGELPRLTRGETGELLAAIAGQEPDPARVDTVFARSEGNPLFVEELLCCGDVLPESLRDLVLARVQRLPDTTQDVLRVASAAGERAGHGLLSAVTGLGDDDVERALRPAVAANVLVADPDGYAFRHALIREAMYEDLMPGERGRVHARYAEAIAADPALAPGRAATQLAYHWYAAHDLGNALASAWQAAAEANRVFAYAEQLAMLAKVSELWDKVPDAAQRIGTGHDRVLEKAGRVALLLQENERSRAFASAALREIDPKAEPGRAALLLELLGRLRLGTQDDGIASFREALSLVSDGQHDKERAKVLASFAMRLRKTHAAAEARATAAEALDLAEQTGDLATQACALGVLATLGHTDGPGISDADLGLLARARSLATQAGDHHLMLDTTISESHLLQGIGEHERAVQVARDGIAEAARYGLARTEGTFLAINVAEPLYSLGRWDEASEVIERALALSAPPRTRACLQLMAGAIALARGELAAASSAITTADQLLGGLDGRVSWHAEDYLLLAQLRIELLTAQGRPSEALALAQASLHRYDLQASPRYAWPLLVAAARAAAGVAVTPAAVRAEGSADAAGDLIGALRTEAGKLEAAGPVQRAQQLTWAAEVLRAEYMAPGASTGPAEQAAAWEQAAAAREQTGQPYPLAIALFRAAEAALASGAAKDVAGARLHRAAEIAADLGARPLGEAVALLARRAGIPTGSAPAGRHTAAAGLTPRELEVLRLVAAGMSNAGIASELFISRKTASVHVSNIMSKLDATSRGEAAAIAHKLRLLDTGKQ
jgi:DNA-binding CsgD family transcriptional regulator/tetratricopeptide (TPR) repeat protein